MITAIASICVFLFVILIHEFGHFIVAKKSGILVNEFSVGMGPKIFSKQYHETLYSLRILPIGGYCLLEGEDEVSDNPRSFSNAKASKRLFTILAGALMNFLMAFILCIALMSFMKPIIRVQEVVNNSPAHEAGFQNGDQIIKINGKEITDDNEVLSEIKNSNGSAIHFQILRNEKSQFIHVTPDKVKDQYTIGIVFGKIYEPGNISLAQGIRNGIEMFLYLTKMIYGILWKLITLQLSVSNLSGPVGVIQQIGNAAKMGFSNLVFLVIYININLGIFNLLPIPALDGGRAIFILYEIVTKRSVPKEREATIHLIGLFLLLALIAIVSVKDIVNLF